MFSHHLLGIVMPSAMAHCQSMTCSFILKAFFYASFFNSCRILSILSISNL